MPGCSMGGSAHAEHWPQQAHSRPPAGLRVAGHVKGLRLKPLTLAFAFSCRRCSTRRPAWQCMCHKRFCMLLQRAPGCLAQEPQLRRMQAVFNAAARMAVRALSIGSNEPMAAILFSMGLVSSICAGGTLAAMRKFVMPR